MTDRCEPPPELRDKDGWHWLSHDSYIIHIARKWWLSQRYGRGFWMNSGEPEDMHAAGWRYHAPIPDPPAEPYQSPQGNDDVR